MAKLSTLCTILSTTFLHYAVYGHNHHPYIRVHYGPPYRPVVSLVSVRRYMYPCAQPMPCGQLRALLVAIDFDSCILHSAERPGQRHKCFTAGGNIGDAKDAPENTIAALKLALERNNVVMFDVRLASDGKAVVIKDGTTNRTMKSNLIVADTPSKDLINLTSRSSSERIPLLESILDECRNKDAKVVIQAHESSAALLSEISDYVKKYHLYTKVVVTSRLPTVSFYMKRHDKNMLTGITYSRHEAAHHYQKTHPKSLFFKLLGQFIDDSMQVLMRSLLLPRFIGTEVIFVSYKDVSENFAKDVMAEKMHLVAYDVNERTEQERLHDITVPYFAQVLKA